jgi:hypothetical protein
MGDVYPIDLNVLPSLRWADFSFPLFRRPGIHVFPVQSKMESIKRPRSSPSQIDYPTFNRLTLHRQVFDWFESGPTLIEILRQPLKFLVVSDALEDVIVNFSDGVLERVPVIEVEFRGVSFTYPRCSPLRLTTGRCGMAGKIL